MKFMCFKFNKNIDKLFHDIFPFMKYGDQR